MCYYLRIASPLTLSEVRSMLPAGIASDVLPPEAAGPPVTRTVAEVRADPEGWLTEGRPLIVVS